LRDLLLRVLKTCYPLSIMKLNNILLPGLVALAGCTSAVNPGATLWASLNNYHEEMRTLEARPERWPERQELAQSIKTTYVATLGGSREFNRLVDLDLRRREFLIALRDSRLKPDRAREIEEELATIKEQIDGFAKVVKGQFINTQLNVQDPSKTIETVATIGLLNLAIDAFSSSTNPNPTAVPSTQVGPYVVMEQGLLSSAVRTPEGQTFRCTTTMVPQEGASIQCQPAGGKS
jgi:hypothetical protein